MMPEDYVRKSLENVHAADYRAAFRVINSARKRWPDNFQVAQCCASVLGDYAEMLPPSERRSYKEKACKMLFALIRRMRSMDSLSRSRTRNEYYYHSAQFKKQYLLGIERVAGGDKTGYYSQGVGAAWHARDLAIKGSWHWAKFWSRRAIKAWENYFRINPNYYNAYVHYALALGILERFEEMEASLEKSGRLSGKSQTCYEFAEVREIIKQLFCWPKNH